MAENNKIEPVTDAYRTPVEAGSNGPEHMTGVAPGRHQFDPEHIEAPELERRALMDATDAFAEFMRREHPERVQVVRTESATDRPRMMHRPVEGRTRGWCFE